MAQKLIKRKSPTKSRQASGRNLVAKVEAIEKKEIKGAELPEFRSGDTVRVHVRIVEGGKERIQAFEGVCMGRSNRGAGKSFTVRKMSHGVGVERVFLESSPKVAKVEVVNPGKVRRAKLYYLRNLEGKKAKIDLDIGRESSSSSSEEGSTPATPARH